MEDKEIKVTGERDFGTGAKRDPNKDKGRFDLISPLALMRLAKHTQKGAKLRGARNWEKGMPLADVLDSAIRHIYKYILNVLLGKEQDEDHLAAALWNLMVATHFDELIDMGIGDPGLRESLFGSLERAYPHQGDHNYPVKTTSPCIACLHFKRKVMDPPCIKCIDSSYRPTGSHWEENKVNNTGVRFRHFKEEHPNQERIE